MKVSVSFPTIRSGWLDNTFRALGQQSLAHQDWELVMIDDWGDRWEEVQKLAEEYQINVKYMPSKPYFWKSNRQLGNARNTGFIHCDGELVVFLDDYSWMEPKWLETHWKLYKERGRAVIGIVQAVSPDYGRITSYRRLVLEPRPDERWKSIAPNAQLSQAPPGWFWTFNASAPLEKIVEVNGYDERFDASGEDDVDLGLRLARVGVKFLYTTEEDIKVYHMRHNGGTSRPSPFKPEECHRFTKEVLHVKYDGSWGLLEDNARKPPSAVNYDPAPKISEDGRTMHEFYFRLSVAREHRDKFPVREHTL